MRRNRLMIMLLACSSLPISLVAQSATDKTRASGTCFADQFQGANASAKINSAVADKSCAVVDATGLSGSQKAPDTITLNRSLLLRLSCTTLILSGSPGINITAPGVSIVGVNSYCSVLETGSPTADVIQASGAFLHVENIGFRSAVSRTSGAGLNLLAGHGNFTNLRFDKTYNGIQITSNGGGGQFYGVSMGDGLSPTGNWNAGLIIGKTPRGTVTSSSFDGLQINGGNSKFTDAFIAIYDGADAISFTNTQAVQGGASSVAFKTDAVVGGLWPEWIKCTNCYFEAGDNADGVVINKGRHVEFDNSYAITNSRGLVVNGGVDIKWVGGIIGRNRREGVYLNSSATISQATIGDNSMEKNGAYDDIFVAANVSNFTLSHNSFAHFLTAAPANRSKYNIEVAAGSSSNYKIIANDFTGGTSGTLNNLATDSSHTIWANSPSSIPNSVK